jgi:hypothetical protein
MSVEGAIAHRRLDCTILVDEYCSRREITTNRCIFGRATAEEYRSSSPNVARTTIKESKNEESP